MENSNNSEPKAKSKWPLIIGGSCLLFAGAFLGTYFSSSPSSQTYKPAQESANTEGARKAASANSADAAVKKIETREKAAQDVQRQEKIKLYQKYKAIYLSDFNYWTKANKTDLSDSLVVESVNYLFSIQGLESRFEYKQLDCNDPLVNFYAYRQAQRRYRNPRYGDPSGADVSPSGLRQLAVDAGENFPSEEDLQTAMRKYMAEAYKRYDCFDVPEGWCIAEVADKYDKNNVTFVRIKSRPDLWLETPARKEWFDPNYDAGVIAFPYTGPADKGDIGHALFEIGKSRDDTLKDNFTNFRSLPELKKAAKIMAAFEAIKD